jgi:predicted oxidoreductase
MIWSTLSGGKIFTEQSEKAQSINKAFTDAGNKMGLTTVAQFIHGLCNCHASH